MKRCAGIAVALLLFCGGASAQTASGRDQLIADLVTANHILYRQGVLDGFGHVSVRDPEKPDHFLMSRALAPGRVAVADILEFDLDGKTGLAKGQSAYSERFIHAEIYRARPDVNAVVHSHSPSVVPFSITQVPLKAVVATGSFLANGTPVFDTRTKFGMTDLLIETPERGKALAETLGAFPVVLLRGHGDAVVGPDIYRTVSRAIYTEIDARLLLQAIQIGGPINFVMPEEAAIMEKGRAADGAGSGHGPDRTWGMWKEDAERSR